MLGNRRMARGFSGWLSGCILMLLLGSCARISPVRPAPSVETGCERFFAELDRLTVEAGVRDGGASRVEGAAYLRANRFLASFAGADLSAAAYAEWLERMRDLDSRRRAAETANLRIDAERGGPYSPLPGWTIREVIQECGRRLVERDLRSSERRNWLMRRIAVPDAYHGWRRILGIYPLTRLAFAEGVAMLHREFRKTFARPLADLPQQGKPVRYMPAAPASPRAAEVRERLRASNRNALAIPDPDPALLDRMYRDFAPIWEVDTTARSDRIGALRWGVGVAPEVDVEAPTVYRFRTYTRFQGASLLQLNYLVWFPERPPAAAFDLYAGHLDGVIWRVTLSSSGTALAYDTIHACGCYYLIFPGRGYRVAQPADGSEPLLSPYPLLPPSSGQRFVIRLSAGQHFVQAVYPDAGRDPGVPYRWRDADELHSLPDRGGRRRSAYEPDGLVAGTHRLERLLLWPSGIASPGAMRQPGTHAIAFLGRRHFDDAGLFERVLRPLTGGT